MEKCRPEGDQKHFGALLKVWPKHKKYRKWSSDHYNITISILIVSSIVNARGGCCPKPY